MNWCGLGDNRVEKVLHSHVSARSLTGDHLDAYAIKIYRCANRIDSKKKAAVGTEAISCPRFLTMQSVSVGAWQNSGEIILGFPRGRNSTSKHFAFLWRPDIPASSLLPSNLILVRPSDNTVFYIDPRHRSRLVQCQQSGQSQKAKWSNPAAPTTDSCPHPGVPGETVQRVRLACRRGVRVPAENVLVAMYARAGAIQSGLHSGKDSALER